MAKSRVYIYVYLKASGFLGLQGIEKDKDGDDYRLGDIKILCVPADIEDNCPDDFFIKLNNLSDSVPDLLIPVVENIDYHEKLKVSSVSECKEVSYKDGEKFLDGYAQVYLVTNTNLRFKIGEIVFECLLTAKTMGEIRSLYQKVKQDFPFLNFLN